MRYVFSDGHGIAAFTGWYDDLNDLDKVDWQMVTANYWADTIDDMDRQRRKQAEFLVYQVCEWEAVQEIGVVGPAIKDQVEGIMDRFPGNRRPQVRVRQEWYY